MLLPLLRYDGGFRQPFRHVSRGYDACHAAISCRFDAALPPFDGAFISYIALICLMLRHCLR